MTSLPRLEGLLAEFSEMFEREAALDGRPVRSRIESPAAYGLVMAALGWERVVPGGWRSADEVLRQARRLLALGRVPASDPDGELVTKALAWASRKAGLLERDARGRFRPLIAGSAHWRAWHDAAVEANELTPLELVIRGDVDQHTRPADLPAARRWYRLRARQRR